MDARKNFEEVCLTLNMDSETADSAWDLYQKIDEDYGLEVSEIIIISDNNRHKVNYSCVYINYARTTNSHSFKSSGAICFTTFRHLILSVFM